MKQLTPIVVVLAVAVALGGQGESDAVLVQRPVTDAWIRLMEMDKLTRDGRRQTWIEPGVIHDTDRIIKVKTDVLLVQQPPGARNWCRGCTGRHTGVLWHGDPIAVPKIPSETFESPGVPVMPPSLYLAQLQDRLGAAAVRDIAP